MIRKRTIVLRSVMVDIIGERSLSGISNGAMIIDEIYKSPPLRSLMKVTIAIKNLTGTSNREHG